MPIISIEQIFSSQESSQHECPNQTRVHSVSILPNFGLSFFVRGHWPSVLIYNMLNINKRKIQITSFFNFLIIVL